MMYSDSIFQLYFGDATTGMHPSLYAQWRQQNILSKPEIIGTAQSLNLSNLIFLQQIHSPDGAVLADQAAYSQSSFFKEGDFLCTDQPGVGIGVMTADCVPVVAVDRIHSAIGIAHAGWKGAVLGVVGNMLEAMHTRWGSMPKELEIVIGPSAQRCCYEVSADFIKHLAPFAYYNELITIQENKRYFSVAELIFRQLIDLGMCPAHINREYMLCTICNTQFQSHRRATIAGTSQQEGRQMSIVVLR